MIYAKKLYFVGLIIHLLYNIILLTTDNVISQSWYSVSGQLTESIVKYNYDTKSYIDSADNFIKYGVFGKENSPDFHRTIGYPFIIYIFKSLFGSYWYITLSIFQTFLGALIYPLSFLIGKVLLPKSDKIIYYAIIAMMILGGYFTKSLYVLTDLIFSVFFLAGIYYSLLSVTSRKKILFIFLGILLLTFAALIRPILLFYPIAHFLMLLLISKQYETWELKIIKRIIVISSLFLIVSVNLSSFKNYKNYRNFTPTDILGKDLFEYTVKNVLIYNGKYNDYISMENKLNTMDNWVKKDKEMKSIFFKTVKKYPLSTLRYVIARGAIVHLFYPHYMQMGEIYGYFNKDFNKDQKKMIKSKLMIFVLYFFAMINIIIFLMFTLYMLERLLKNGDILFFLAIFCLMLFVVGPSFIAASSPRLRLPVEPFIFIFAFKYAETKFLSSKPRISKSSEGPWDTQ